MVSSSGTETLLHSFAGSPSDGYQPESGLSAGTDGNLYGTTTGGGTGEGGTVFKITLSGLITILHNCFNDGSDLLSPYSGLLLANDGNFYGTTSAGGAHGGGTVFTLTPSGVVTILYSFGSIANDGQSPLAGLVQGSDGYFYGTTENGGTPSNYGTVFKISPIGTIAILHHFNDGSVANDGYNPGASLIQGSDGNFYGTTKAGGASGQGTVFKITPGGTLTILHSFTGASAGGDGCIATGWFIPGTGWELLWDHGLWR